MDKYEEESNIREVNFIKYNANHNTRRINTNIEDKTFSVKNATNNQEYTWDTYNDFKGNKKEGGNMENDKILEIYISKVDKDQSELKQDMRDSEKRLETHIIESEQRMEAKLDRIERLIDSQNSKIDKVDDKIDKVKDDIHKNSIEQYRFWIGLVASIVIGIASIIVTLVK